MKVCLICDQRFEAEEWDCPHCQQSPSFKESVLIFAKDLIHGDGSDAEYKYAELFAIEEKNFWFKARNRLVIWSLSRYFQQAKNFLEIGCGTGFVLFGVRHAVPELTLSASDILVEGLTFAKQRLPDVTFFQMDARRIPFEAEFDVVGAFDILEHIDEDEVVLSQIFQATRPGGGVILTVPQHPQLWSYLDDFSHHRRRYTRSELITKVERAGFEILHTTSFVSLLLPLLYLSRLLQRRPKEHQDIMAEFRLNPLVNTILEKTLSLERLVIKWVVSLPVGGSLLLIAKRL